MFRKPSLQKANELSACGQGCRVDAVVTIDAKGQMVLPKDLREKAGFKPNGKIAILTFEKEGKICCILMIKTERLCDAVNKTLSPMLKDVIK